jgi:hypothetical protein
MGRRRTRPGRRTRSGSRRGRRFPSRTAGGGRRDSRLCLCSQTICPHSWPARVRRRDGRHVPLEPDLDAHRGIGVRRPGLEIDRRRRDPIRVDALDEDPRARRERAHLDQARGGARGERQQQREQEGDRRGSRQRDAGAQSTRAILARHVRRHLRPALAVLGARASRSGCSSRSSRDQRQVARDLVGICRAVLARRPPPGRGAGSCGSCSASRSGGCSPPSSPGPCTSRRSVETMRSALGVTTGAQWAMFALGGAVDRVGGARGPAVAPAGTRSSGSRWARGRASSRRSGSWPGDSRPLGARGRCSEARDEPGWLRPRGGRVRVLPVARRGRPTTTRSWACSA